MFHCKSCNSFCMQNGEQRALSQFKGAERLLKVQN